MSKMEPSAVASAPPERSVKTAWFNAEVAGIAGDMALGALLDAGAAVDEVCELLAGLAVDGWSLEREPVLRAGLAGTRAVVDAPETGGHRPWRDIRELLDAADLPSRLRRRSQAVFAALAVVEAALHGRAPDDVEFHEVGALDAIVDVVGTCAALEVLGVDDVRCSPIAQGRGTTATAHGLLPVPVPAVVKLLATVGAPTVGVDVGVELTTPTGAALVAALAGRGGFGPIPAMTVDAVGFGAGGRELAGRPNTTQVVIGESEPQRPVDTMVPSETAIVVEANVDDTTGELLAHAVTRLLAVGAHDAWVTPIVMKKGRPAHTVAALAHPAAVRRIADVLATETGTLGVRMTPVHKWRASWSVQEHDIDGHPVRVKVAPGRVKVEHDDAVEAAVGSGVPLREVLVRAEAAALGEARR